MQTQFVAVSSKEAAEALSKGEYLSSSDKELVLKTGDKEVTVLVYDPARYPVRGIHDDSLPGEPEPAPAPAPKRSLLPYAVVSGTVYAIAEVVRWLL